MENKDKKILAFYMRTLLETLEKDGEGKPPTLREIGIEEEISHERARFYIDRLIATGKLLKFKFKKNQKVLFPAPWIERHTKKSLK